MRLLLRVLYRYVLSLRSGRMTLGVALSRDLTIVGAAEYNFLGCHVALLSVGISAHCGEKTAWGLSSSALASHAEAERGLSVSRWRQESPRTFRLDFGVTTDLLCGYKITDSSRFEFSREPPLQGRLLASLGRVRL